MLKITALNLDGRRTLVLEGRLVDPWLTELERVWQEEQQPPPQRVVVDLKDVTAISERGEELLKRMKAGGATINCCRGVLTRHVVKELMQRNIRGKGVET